MDLLGDDSDREQVDFTINEDYAKKYERWRRGEEIQKLKDKYGDVDDSESSTSEEEDEDAVELTKDVEKQFYKTLSCLKEKNPKIYDPNVRFFDKEVQDGDVKVKKTKEPTLTLAGYQRKVLLETGGKFSDSEEEEGHQQEQQQQPFELMSSQDQENDIKQSFKDILKDSDNENDDNDNWGNLFTKRVKTTEELQKEEEDYKQWLAGENEKLENAKVQEELKGLHDYWADPKLDEGEKFLRDYILNKRYIDGEKKNRLPTYDEIVHASDEDLSADEEMVHQQDEFEHKYNFRFEEPDSEFIKRYPRTMEQSMRKKDDRRKKHREEVRLRKQAERSKKDEELKRLKALKKKEILEKIKKLQHITGNEDMAFEAGDLEGDFDPEAHDKRMSQIFDDEYYRTGGEETEKPEFPENDRELGIENWDEWDGNEEEGEEEELHCEDPGFNMDCDYDPTKKELENEMIENSRRRKRKKKSKFAECLAKKKPVFDPKDKTFEQYVDEYYALDYEDLIGDIPCRFKYRKVVPNDFGLSVEEILNATDQELNRWVSLKKIVKRRPENVELFDVKAYKRRGMDIRQKRKFFPSIYGPKTDGMDQSPEVSKRGQDSVSNGIDTKNESQEVVEERNEEEGGLPRVESLNESISTAEGGKRKRKRNKRKKPIALSDNGVGDAGIGGEESQKLAELTETSEGEPPMKKPHVSKGDVTVESETPNTSDNKIKKRRKKKKKRGPAESATSVRNGEGTDAPQKVNAENIVESVNRDESQASDKKKKKIKVDESPVPEEYGRFIRAPVTDSNSGLGKKKKKKKKKKAGGEADESMKKQSQKAQKRKRSSGDSPLAENGEFRSRKKKFNLFNGNDKGRDTSCNMSDERLKSYGINPKKYRNRLKYKKD